MRDMLAAGALLLPATVPAQALQPGEEPNPTQEQIERAEKIDAVADILRPKLKPVGPTELLMVAETLVDESIAAGFDPLFVIALMEYESGFNVLALSPTKSKGLMQLQHKTWLLVKVGEDIWDPVENVRAGIRVLKRIKDAGFRRAETILLAYNQGPKKARQWSQGKIHMPAEAVPYIPGIMARYGRLLKAQGLDPHDAKKTFAWNFPERRPMYAAN
jgi:soluble lytic murein transglycosylase-like protein